MSTSPEPQKPRDVDDVGDDEPDFEQVLDSDPAGAPLLDRLERLMIIVALGSTALTAVAVDLSVSLGWFAGAGLSVSSVAVARRILRRLVAGGVGGTTAALILATKVVVVLAVVYLVLTRLPASPIAFACGHLTVVAGLVLGTVLMAPRPQRGTAGTAPPEAKDDDGE